MITMSITESFINGFFFALGTVIASTVCGYLIFKYTKNWLTKTIAEIWTKVKEEGLKIDDLYIDGHLETRDKRSKKKNLK